MLVEMTKEHKEALSNLKWYLFNTGPCYTHFQIKGMWQNICGVLVELGVESADFWICADNNPDNLLCLQISEDAPEISIEDKKVIIDPIGIMSNLCIVLNEVDEEKNETFHMLFGNFKSINKRHTAGCEIAIYDPFEHPNKYYDELFREIGLLLEVFHSRIFIRDNEFSEIIQKLTKRQKEVFKEHVQGKLRKDAALDLKIALNTFDNHMKDIKEYFEDENYESPSFLELRGLAISNGNAEGDFENTLKEAMSSLTGDERSTLENLIKELQVDYDVPEVELQKIAFEILY